MALLGCRGIVPELAVLALKRLAWGTSAGLLVLGGGPGFRARGGAFRVCGLSIQGRMLGSRGVFDVSGLW